jgi:hypothetical protein
MLIENSKNTYQADEIVSFKTVSGDEVLGKLVSSANGAYELNKPCLVVTSPEGIGLIQAMFGLDPELENISIRDQHVISMCRTHEKMRDHYIKVINTQG